MPARLVLGLAPPKAPAKGLGQVLGWESLRPLFLPPAMGLPQLQHFRSTLCPWGPQARRARGSERQVQLPEEACGRNKSGGGCGEKGEGCWGASNTSPPPPAVCPGSREASWDCAQVPAPG